MNGNIAARTAGVVVRDAAEADMEAVARIYAHYVEHGLATFEEVPPSDEEMRARRAEGAGDRRALSRRRDRRRSRRLLLRRALPRARRLSAYARRQRLCRAGPRRTRRRRRAARRTDRALRSRPVAVDRGDHRRQRQCRVDRSASALWLRAGRDAALGRLQARSLGRHADHAARAGAGDSLPPDDFTATPAR